MKHEQKIQKQDLNHRWHNKKNPCVSPAASQCRPLTSGCVELLPLYLPLDSAQGVESLCAVQVFGLSAHIINALSVPLVFFTLVRGAVSSARESGGVTGGLQMVKQLVSWGEFFLTGHTVEVDFLLEEAFSIQRDEYISVSMSQNHENL